jgi:8-oxo-dGTP pyrophosphatase MutT (NUDIX family)
MAGHVVGEGRERSERPQPVLDPVERFLTRSWAGPAAVSPAAYGDRVTGTDERPESLAWRVHGERTIYDNPWVRLVLVDVEPPDGRRFEHHVVRLQRVVAAVVLDDEDRVLMLWRHRFVDDSWGWELPGGIVDAGEDPAAAAAREVEEETGWRPGPMKRLLTFQPMIGMVDTPHEVYAADSAIRVGDPTDLVEAGRVDWIPMAAVLDLIGKGEVLGAGSLVGLLHVLASRQADPG